MAIPTNCGSGFEANQANGEFRLEAPGTGSRGVVLRVEYATYYAPDSLAIDTVDANGFRRNVYASCRMRSSCFTDPTGGRSRPPEESIRAFNVGIAAGTKFLVFRAEGSTPTYIRILGLCDFNVPSVKPSGITASRWKKLSGPQDTVPYSGNLNLAQAYPYSPTELTCTAPTRTPTPKPTATSVPPTNTPTPVPPTATPTKTPTPVPPTATPTKTPTPVPPTATPTRVPPTATPKPTSPPLPNEGYCSLAGSSNGKFEMKVNGNEAYAVLTFPKNDRMGGKGIALEFLYGPVDSVDDVKVRSLGADQREYRVALGNEPSFFRVKYEYKDGKNWIADSCVLYAPALPKPPVKGGSCGGGRRYHDDDDDDDDDCGRRGRGHAYGDHRDCDR